MPTCLICIGSNHRQEESISLAQRKLRELFLGIRFSTAQETTPLYLTNPALFTNQVALFHTEHSQAFICRELKEIERVAGRVPADKEKEQICLDLDLLTYGNEVLKARDMEQAYVISGIRELIKTNE